MPAQLWEGAKDYLWHGYGATVPGPVRYQSDSGVVGSSPLSAVSQESAGVAGHACTVLEKRTS